MEKSTTIPYELAVTWSTGEEEGVRLVMRSDNFADVKQKATEFLALIRTERLLYNENVTKPLYAKQEELEEAIQAKARELRDLQQQLDTAALTTNGLHP